MSNINSEEVISFVMDIKHLRTVTTAMSELKKESGKPGRPKGLSGVSRANTRPWKGVFSYQTDYNIAGEKPMIGLITGEWVDSKLYSLLVGSSGL